MIVDRKDFEDNYQQVYSNAVRKVNSLEEKDSLSEEEQKTLEVYRNVEKYFTRKVNQKEFLVIDGRNEEYISEVIRGFVLDFSREFPARFILLMLTREFEGVKSLIQHRIDYGEEFDVKELSGIVSTMYEIEHFKTVYLPTEAVLVKELVRVLEKELEILGININSVEMDGTVNSYKTILYGSVYSTKNDLEEYEIRWLNTLGYSGDVNTEDNVNFAKVSSRLLRVLEGKFREPSKKEKQVGDRFLEELKKGIQKEESNIGVEVQPLDSKDSKVVYIGNKYEVIIRKRFTVHKRDGNDTKHYITLTSVPVYKTKVGHIKKVTDGILKDSKR